MLVLALGCRSPDPAAPPRPTGALVAFDLRDGAALFDAPFPSDHRLRDGRVDAADWPNPDGIPYVEVLIGLTAQASGFGTTSGALFRLEDPDTALVAQPLAESITDDAVAFVVPLDGGPRVPVDLHVERDGGPFGAPGMVTLLPLQGIALAPRARYAAVLRRGAGVEPLGVAEDLWAIGGGRVPDGVDPEVARIYADALDGLAARGVPRDDVAALAVFDTWDPTDELRRAVATARALPTPTPAGPLTVTEVYPTFCVLESTLELPVYQEGTPPYLTEGGGWTWDADGQIAQQGTATSRLWLTVPRASAPPDGYPIAVMVRTGGGGDRPLVDRGTRDAGGYAAPGTGPAVQFAEAGFVGVQVDGPHGGPYRNPTGADEQFLMFNVGNPIATRDNVRQSALELALLPPILAGLDADGSGCPGASAAVPLNLDHIALLGHSMGATIAPLTLAAAPELDEVVLSGAGGSYLYNLVYKRSPLEVRPLAESLLGYTVRGRTLHEYDAVLQLLQWVSEPADPPPYAPQTAADVLQVQGIVDTYILPPMANASSLAFGLDLVGPERDLGVPEYDGMRTLADVLPYGGGEARDLPAEGGELRAVMQLVEDGIEDGHEVLFQRDVAKHAYACFLASAAAGAPRVPADGAPGDPCD